MEPLTKAGKSVLFFYDFLPFILDPSMHVHNETWSHLLHIFLLQLLPDPHYTLHAPTQFRVFYFFNNPLSSVSVAHMCMGMGLTTGAWEFHRWPFKANATTLSSYSLINPRSALSLNLACRPCFPTGFSVPLRHYPLCSLPDLPFFQRVNPGKTVEVEKRSS